MKKCLVLINNGTSWCTEIDATFSNSSIENVKMGSVVSKTNSISQNKPTTNDLQNVLQSLHLTEKYPQQLSLRDALIIKSEILASDIKLSNLPYVVLHKIIACDFRSRSFLLPSESANTTFESSSDSESSDSDSERDSSTLKGDQSIVHPVDVILALLYCSNNFLRQVLLAKLSVCQMAIPLLLPDTIKGTVTLLLWALRSVKKTWNVPEENGKVVTRKSSIVDYESPVISFLKCGKLRMSKLELLNNVIGQENIFFHWNLEYQNCRKTVSQGVVELSCYYPSTSTDDSNFNDVIIFTNLRGDALKYTKQVAFIENISFISFILISKKSITSGSEHVKVLLQTLARCPGGLVILLVDAKSYKKEKLKDFLQCDNFSVIGIHSKSALTIQREIRSYIAWKLQNICSKKFMPISCFADTAHKLDIIVDEDDSECMKGKQKALLVMNHIAKSKNEILPLQGKDLWGTWALHNKERYRHRLKQSSHDISVAGYMRSKDEEKTAIRLLQYHCNFSEFTKEFLVSLMQSRNERNYFLHWLKECLINHSKDILPALEQEYEQTYKKIKSAADEEVGKKIKNLLNQQNKKLIDVSFGLEHCFREVGQLYEAAKGIRKDATTKQVTEYINLLP